MWSKMGGVQTTGTLTLAAAPIGRAEDASARLRAALGAADIIAAEDTRRLRRLTADLGVTPSARVVSYYDANERARAAELLEELREGRDVLVITDAGLPGVSDPGYRLVTAAIEADVPVTVLPGPVRGHDRPGHLRAAQRPVLLRGVPAAQGGGAGGRLAALAEEPRTMVFFEAPHRLTAALEAMAAALGADRPAAVCRELTKTYEEVRRGPLGELAEWSAAGVRGEITVVVGGAPDRSGEADLGELAEQVERRVAEGVPRKEAIVEIARKYGVPKRGLYDAVIARKTRDDDYLT